MNKLLTVLLLLVTLGTTTTAQLNMQLVGERSYDAALNDVWGWVAPDGTEYALVGTALGVSIVSLADPANPSEVAFVGGPTSVWRDIKTWDHYAYVSNENNAGLQIIDLSGLPQSVQDTFWTVDFGGRTLSSIHNLYIDSVGYCYIAGSNLSRGGPLIVDLNVDPWEPDFIGAVSNIYAHDIYVRGDLLYSSELNEGRMAIYDISEKTAPLLLGTQQTPYNFTHNIWLSDDGRVAFTTDERETAPVAAYDVSDPTNIVELDQFRPAATLAEGNIPHNVHVWRDWLVISYYRDGGIIVDASRPTNLVEVGNFDTFFNLDPGSGAWGAYPYLPSGLVLVTDIGNGLFVLEPNYVRAAWLEGKVTDAVSGAALNGVRVEILSGQPNVELSDLSGNYKTGQALAGEFTVRFFKTGYAPEEALATLANGQLTVLNIALSPLSAHRLSGITLREAGGAVIRDAQVVLRGEQGRFEEQTDEDGLFQIPGVYQGDYQLYVGKWGYLPRAVGSVRIRRDTAVTVNLKAGYQDDFFFDLGWESTLEGAGSRGAWVLGEPRGTYFGNSLVNPEFDIAGDLGDQCYQTGNAGGSAGTDDLDDAVATLISPPMDLTGYQDPVLTYYAWFFNGGGSPPPNDSLRISVTNGRDTVVLENITPEQSMGAWRPEAFFHLKDYLELTDNMQLIVVTADLEPNGHLVEAALDFVRVRELDVINSTVEAEAPQLAVQAFPNPFTEQLQLDLQQVDGSSPIQLTAFDQWGRRLFSTIVPSGTTYYELPAGDWAPGLYYLQLQTADQRRNTLKVVKVD